MFSHIMVGTSDLQRAAAFYDGVLLPLGLKRRQVIPDGGPDSACWVSPDHPLPRFYVTLPFNRQQATVANGGMVAFTAPSPDAVDRAYRAGIAAGGTDDGPPGERLHYGAGYYGAYLRDPDGNKLHIVHRGDLPLSKQPRLSDVCDVAKPSSG